MMFNETVSYLKENIPFTPKVAIIAGTGLSALANDIAHPISIPYADIPGFATCSAPSHKGTLVAGFLANIPVMVFNGRFHYYEGYTMQQIVYPVRIARLLGTKYLFLTNAAGSLNLELAAGDIVPIKDHINLLGTNPLIGSNTLSETINLDGIDTNELGERFPSLHAPYDPELRKQFAIFAQDGGLKTKEGVYCALTGPTMETKAECMMLQKLGGDVVGMSTVPEVIAAVHCGMRVLATSVVTNLTNIFHSNPHTQSEIQQNADIASKHLIAIFKEIILNLR